MDFEARDDNRFDSADEINLQTSTAPAAAPGRGATQVLAPGADGIVVLPAGTELDDIRVEGRDLVIVGENGVRFVIPDGAIIVPQIVVEGVAIPPANLAALLTGNEPEPAAGAPRSSGGNFASAVGPLQAAYALGNLLPYTELSFPEPEEREIIPQLVDREPGVIIITPDQPAGATAATAQVNEAGLPRGSDAAANSETTTGTLRFDALDGIDSITLNGTAITAVGQTITTANGVLTITSIAPGAIGYSYTLTTNIVGQTTVDTFVVAVTDTDGDVATATLDISVIDDAPTARDDTDALAAGTYGPQTGNVMTGSGTTSGAAGADTQGADGATVSAISGARGSDTAFDASGNLVVAGQYGTLTIRADGSYSYVRAPGTPGGVTDTFTYTLTDADGSADTATLAIAIGDSPASVISLPTTGAGTIVNEAGLPPRTGEAPGTNAPAPTETTSGTITVNAPDGPLTVAIGGVVVTGPGQVIALPQGSLTVTSYDPATGEVGYSFTLTDNTSGDTTVVSIPVTVTDVDGDSDTKPLVITITDDAPIAVNDAAAQSAENAPVIVNVFANDIQGADSVQTSTIALVPGTLTGTGTLANNGDGTFTYTPGRGEQGTVTFQYSITDGDGDSSTATVTIALLPDSIPAIATAGDTDVSEAGLPARGGEPAGTQAAGDGEFASGTIAITTGGDAIGSLTINGQTVTGGGTVTTAKGTLTVTPDGTGGYSYTYALADNTLSDPDSDSFQIAITDSDGSLASATLTIAIVDDVPTAADDTAALAAGSYGPIGGNVVANDTPGADGVTVTAYTGTGAAVATGEVAQGQYGTLTIAADGTFLYTRDPGSQGGVSDTFTYTITDGDGDTATATLTITIPDSVPTLDVPVSGEAGTMVLEAGLPTGSAAATDGEFTSGTIAFTAPDGPAILTIDGQPVTVGATYAGASGTLTVTAIGADTVSYTYALTSNTDGDATFDDFLFRVTDQDGDFVENTLTIDIVDDVPTARPDTDTVTEDGPLTASGNVVTDGEANGDAGADTAGADGATVTGIAFGASTGTIGTPLAGEYGSLAIDASGAYTYTLDNADPRVQGLDSTQTLTEVFTYTLTDGDSDASPATLTITIRGADDGVTITGLNAEGAELVFDEDDLPLGSSPDEAMLTRTGTFAVDAQDGIVTISVGGTVIYTGGAFVPGQTIATPYGTLTFTAVSEDTIDASGDVTHATVSYSYTLNANTLDHTGADDGALIDSYAIAVTDSDNTVQTDTLYIQLIDDVPTAADDEAAQSVENQAFTIDALANDVFGADRVDTGDATKVFVSTQAAQGTVTYDPGTGQFTYTPDAGAGGAAAGTTDSFAYTIVDRDGDVSTATVTVTLKPDSTPTGGTATAAVDDDGLAGANPAPDAADIDANAGDAPADTSEASFTGTLTYSVGGDGPASIAFAATLDGSTGTVGLEQVTYSVAGSVVTATVSSGARTGTALFEVEILDPAAGTYQVRLFDNVLNAGGPNGEATDATAAIGFLVTDSDGSTGTTNLSIVFNDDRPSAWDDGGMVDEGGSTGGNVLTDGTDDVFGADGGSITAFSGSGGTAAPGGQIETALGVLTLNADGSYTYQSKANSTNVPVSDTFTYTITDGDGDTATATLTIAIAPAAGAVSDTDVNVDEAGLGNAAYTGSDPAAASETGTGSITVTDGGIVQAAGDYTYALIGANSSGDGTYGTLVLNAADGTYSYTLDTPYDDAVEPGEYTRNVVNGAESFEYEVRDSFGNVVGTGFIAVNIKDDVPTAQDYAGGTFVEGSGAHVIGDAATLLGIVEGADGLTGPLQSIAFTNAGSTGGSVAINAAGELVYTAPSSVTSAAMVTETFRYTITDNDGDTVTKTVTFGVSDTGIASPAATNASVDEDAMTGAGGNPDGPGDLAAPVPTGTISYTAGQDAITAITLSTGALGFTKLDGTAITTSYDSATGVLTGYGTSPADVVFTITLGAIGQGSTTYTVNLLQPVKHTVTDDPATAGTAETAFEDDKSFAVSVVVTDADGSTANTSFSVLIDDDSPVASTINAVQTAENTAFDIPLSGSFSPGADGLGSIILGTANQGTVTLNGTTVTYTPNSGAGSTSTSDSFTYTIIDRDGDAVTQTVNVTLQPDSTPTAVNANAFVDDDGLAGANPAGTGDDDQNRASETGAGIDNEAIFTGSIASPTGSTDGPLAYSFAAAAGTATVGTETVALTWSGSTLTATVAAGQARAGTVLFTVDVDTSTGAYTVTLKAPIAHASLDGLAGDNTENNTSVVLNYTVNDSDTNPAGGDTANGTLTIDFDDDVPSAVADTNTASEGGSVTSDVDMNDIYGADGPAATSGGVVGVRAGSDTTTAASGSLGGAGITTTLGTLVLNADGSYTYTARPNTITEQATDTFVYTIRDADGDLSTTTLTITVNPVNLTGVTGNVIVYEKALDTTVSGADVAAGTVTGSEPSDTGETATGTVTVAGATSYSIAGGTDNGTTITVVGDYGTIVIDKATGAYTYTLTAPFTTTPPINDGVITEQDKDVFTYTASDAAGNTVTGVINVDIVDDVPRPYSTAPTTATGVNAGTDAESADYSLNLPDVGADKPGTITFTTAAGQQALDTSGNPLTFNGQDLYYNLSLTDPTVLEARTSATPGAGTLVFEIDLDPATGDYTFTQFEQLSTAVLVPITNLSSIGGGNIPAKAVDVPNTPLDIILTTKPGATVNTNANQIGIGSGQSLAPNDAIRVDLVQNTAITRINGNDVLTYGEYYSANSFRQDVSGVGGGSGGGSAQRADFTVTAYTVVEAPGSTPSQPADGDSVFYGDTNDVRLTDTSLNIYNQNGVLQTTAQLTAAGVTVTETSPGVWQVLNLPNGYDFEITSTTSFQAVQINALGASDTFKLGAISMNALQVQGATFEVPIALTDADGDRVTSAIRVDLAAPATPIVLDLDGDGVEFAALAAGVAYDYGNGLVSTAWAGADDGLLARSTGHGLDVVFSDDATGAGSDLDGLRMAYDSNGDGALTSADSDWSTFGIWQDADTDGVLDAGEFRSLTEAGITAIGLGSDGAAYTAADGDVAVFGSAGFTRADGTTGSLADAAFATEVRGTQRTAEAVAVAAAAGALVYTSAAAAAAPVQPADGGTQTAPDTVYTHVDAATVGLGDHAAPATGTANLLGTPVSSGGADAPASSLHAGTDAPARAHGDMAAERSADLPAQAQAADDGPAAAVHAPLFAGMGGDGMMAALLSLGAGGPPPSAGPAGMAQMHDALTDHGNAMMIDTLVDHFAGVSLGSGPAMPMAGSDAGSALLAQSLDGGMSAHFQFAMPDITEDAHAIAAAVA